MSRPRYADVCDYTDFFVIPSGANPRQTKSIHDEVHAVLKHEQGLFPRSTGGVREATWIVADYNDVVLHVFTPETRGFYRLEDLWNDVPKLEAATEGGPRGGGRVKPNCADDPLDLYTAIR